MPKDNEQDSQALLCPSTWQWQREKTRKESVSCSANLCVNAVNMWPSHCQVMGTVIALAQQLETLRQTIKHPRCLEDLLESRKGCLPRLSHSLACPAP